MGDREDKIRQRLFPNRKPFDPAQGGYAAMPFVLRRMLYRFEPRSWQVYSYVTMRIGPSGIGWLTFDEMAWDLDFRSIPKLKPYVSKLVADGWLLHAASRAREYFLVPDPVDVIRSLHAKKMIPPDRVESIDELLALLKLPPLETDLL
jgi:hypothetical protein